MKRTILLALAVFIVGFGLGMLLDPSERALRRAAALNRKQSIPKKREALAVLAKSRPFERLGATEARFSTAERVVSYSLGKLYAQQRMWLLAQKYLEQAESILPYDYDIQYNLAGVYMQRFLHADGPANRADYAQKALHAVDIAIEKSPSNPDIGMYYIRGLVYMHQKLYRDALAAFERILEKDALHVEAALAAARIYVEMGQLEKAKSIYLYLENQLDAKHPKMRVIQQNLLTLSGNGP